VAGTKSGAAKRERCTCGSFLHPGKPCPKRGGSRVRTTPKERAEKRRARARVYAAENAAAMSEAQRRDRVKLKAEVIAHYGGCCQCCGETEIVFLTIDHVDDDGAERRRKEGHRGGTQQYRLLRRQGYPDGFRVLCWNCNAAIHMLGGKCPHQGQIGEQ
jgi:hypothetical protein